MGGDRDQVVDKNLITIFVNEKLQSQIGSLYIKRIAYTMKKIRHAWSDRKRIRTRERKPRNPRELNPLNFIH